MTDGFSRRQVLGGVATSAIGLPDVAGAADPAGDGDNSGDRGGIRLDNRMRGDEQWARFLAEQDLTWGRMPKTWYEGPFLGNGFLGSIVYQEPGANALRFTVQHSQAQDHRPEINGDQWGVARLPVGHLTLRPVGRITGVELRL